MKVDALLFRYRMVINALIVFLGFWAPWSLYWGIGTRISLLEWLALQLSRTGLVSFGLATPIVIVCGALVAAIGAVFRVWAAACLGSSIVVDTRMQAEFLMADGPYRYVRNPLYFGMECVFAAIGLIMPASGALFVVVAAGLFQLQLIRGEEAFLATQLGEKYQVYLRSVPRFFPRLRTRLRHTGVRPRWKQGILSEIIPIGVFLTIACLSWTYDSDIMGRAMLVTLGVSLVVRALMPTRQSADLPR